MELKICVLPGDGIGPEIVAQGLKVLQGVADGFDHQLVLEEALLGGAAIDACGEPLPEKTVASCRKSQAVLLGAVGGPKWDQLDSGIRPERGLLGIRKALGLFANLRPAVIFPALKNASLLRPDLVAEGVDLVVVRELTGGIYFGTPKGVEQKGQERIGYNTMVYSETEIRRIARVAFDIARRRNRRLCSVDKANVLDVSRLWRDVVNEVGREYPEVELTHMYVDNAAMQLVREPGQFDVLLTSNLFGDILSDEAATITGSIGMLASASLGEQNPGLFEPIHGSAPDIAGQDRANPLATILSVAMLLEHAFGLGTEAAAIQGAVEDVLAAGYRTADLAVPGTKVVGCQEMGDQVLEAVMRRART